MKLKETVVAVSIIMASSGAFAWGNSSYSAGSSTQSAIGYNSAQATSTSRGNGSAFNAAGSSLLVGGKTKVDVRRMSMSNTTNGTVRGIGYSVHAADVKQVNTWAVSNNSGNSIGSASSFGSAYGSGHGHGYVIDHEGNRCRPGDKAESRTYGSFSNRVSASSYAQDSSPRVNMGVEVSEHNAIAGASLDLTGFAGVSNGAAIAKDSKEVTTFADTFKKGRGHSFATSTGRAQGYVFERTSDFEFKRL